VTRLAGITTVLVAIAAGLSACGSSGKQSNQPAIHGTALAQVSDQPITKTAFAHLMAVTDRSARAATTKGKSSRAPVIPDPPTYKGCIAGLLASGAPLPTGNTKPTTAQLKTECEQQYKAMQQQVLTSLIQANWLEGEAAALRITVSNAEVAGQFHKFVSEKYPDNRAFQKFLATTGYTVSDVMRHAKLELLSEKIGQKVAQTIRERVGKPSQKELETYFEQHHGKRLGEPEGRIVEVVVTKDLAQAEKAKAEIRAGKSFASVAKAHSIDTNSKTAGGVLPELARNFPFPGIVGAQAEAVTKAVFSAKSHVLSGPLKTSSGYYLYEVKKVDPATLPAFHREEASIRQEVIQQKETEAYNAFQANYRKKWTARTECRAEYVVAECKNYKPRMATAEDYKKIKVKIVTTPKSKK
jgi:foldase protein PrsA